MAPAGEDLDSGMESLNTSSKDLTPEKVKSFPDEDFDEEDVEETLSERLWGLTEMFPEGLRSMSTAVASSTCTGLKGLYHYTRVGTWLFFSSSIILFAPIIFEVERAQVEEMQRSQQKQMLLGPNSAMAGMPHGQMPAPPR